MPEFRIQRCLGRGGFGEVYRGTMSRGGGVEVEVAIKVLRPDLEPESQGVQRLRDEGRLLGRLTHPTILRVYDLVVIQGRAALVSEYVAGDDLGRLLREDLIPPRAVFEVVAQVGAALDAAWSWPSVTDGKALHLVHRDVKPDNIRIDPHGVVKLLDFGIAQAQTVWREAQTSVNTIMGSTHYLAPERLVQQEVGPEADVFALGCTLFEALTGEALFVRKSMRQMYVLMVDERRFEEFLGERCEARRDRLGGERSIALLRAMTAWRKQNRPTGAEVAARCDMISDSTEGSTLTQWCRTRVWPPPKVMEGPLDGYTFVTSMPMNPDSEPVRAPPPAPGPPPVPRAADPEINRAPVLGEAGDPSLVASGEGALPWSAAEMVAVLASAPEVVLRIPQLVRQSPSPHERPNGVHVEALDPSPLAARPWVDEDAVTEVNEEGLDPPEVVMRHVPELQPAAPIDPPPPDPGATGQPVAPPPEFVFEGPAPVFDGEEFPTVRIRRVVPTEPPPAEPTAAVAAPAPAPVLAPILESKPQEFAEGPTEIAIQAPPPRPSVRQRGAEPRARKRRRAVSWAAGASGAAGLIVGVVGLLILVVLAWFAGG